MGRRQHLEEDGRKAIHSRERGFCFYCLRQLTPLERCLDHVVPRSQGGRNSYRNLVSSCVECNSTKGMTRVEDFLRSLYRRRRLTDVELNGRLRALDALAAGKLRPVLNANPQRPPTASPSACVSILRTPRTMLIAAAARPTN